MFPQLKVYPRPEPDISRVDEHRAWKKEYDQWVNIRCPCGRGYFCREHGDWISGDEVGAKGAVNADAQQPGSCPRSHYLSK